MKSACRLKRAAAVYQSSRTPASLVLARTPTDTLQRSGLTKHYAPHPGSVVSRRQLGTMADGAASTGNVAAQASAGESAPQDFLVQYVVVRKDLWTSSGWPLGSVVAQACHASSAAMWMYKDEPETQAYLAPDNIDHMRKVVLELKDEAALRKLSETLSAAGVGHKLWVEQPENYPTCLATRPYPKSQVAQYFKKFQLSKAPIG